MRLSIFSFAARLEILQSIRYKNDKNTQKKKQKKNEQQKQKQKKNQQKTEKIWTNKAREYYKEWKLAEVTIFLKNAKWCIFLAKNYDWSNFFFLLDINCDILSTNKLNKLIIFYS